MVVLPTPLFAAIGHNLSAVSAEVYAPVHGTPDRSQPIELLLLIGGQRCVFSCASDGASLLVDDRELAASDMQHHGQTILEDWSGDQRFSHILGTQLHEVAFFQSLPDMTIIGYRLSFTGSTFDVINNGDELCFGSLISPEVLVDVSVISFAKQ